MSHEKHSGLLSYVRRGIGGGELIVKFDLFVPLGLKGWRRDCHANFKIYIFRGGAVPALGL